MSGSMDVQPARRATPLRQKLAWAAAPFLIALALAEILFRVRGVSDPVFERPDPVLGSAFIPGVSGWYTREGRAYVRINSAGFRDLERDPAKPAGTYRIAVLGDSFVAAFEVPLEQTFCSVMDEEFRKSPVPSVPKIEVLNFGGRGYGTGQELLVLRDRVWRYDPDLVVLAFFAGNDFRDNSRVLGKDPSRPYFVLEGDSLKLDDSFRERLRAKGPGTWARGLLTKAINSSRVLQLATRLYLRSHKDPAAGKKAAERILDGGLDDSIFSEPTDPDWKEAWRLTEALLLRMKQDCAERDVPFAVFTVGTGPQVHPEAAVRAQFEKTLGVNDLSYMDRRIEALGDRGGFPVLTLAPFMLKYAEEHHVFLHGFGQAAVVLGQKAVGKGHWNATGHRLAGELIAKWLRNEVIAPRHRQGR